MKPKDRSENFSFHQVRFMYTTNRTWRRIAIAALIALFLVIAVVIAILIWYFAFRGQGDMAQKDSSVTEPSSAPAEASQSNPDNPYNGCFPPEAIVITPNGPRRMDQLRLGDHVMDLRPDRTCCQWTPVYAFVFLDDHRRILIEIETSEHRIIRLTPTHLLFRLSENNAAEDVEASDMEPGQLLLTSNGTARVTRVQSLIGKGAHSPMTYSGSLLVDDVWASCFAGKWLGGAAGHRFIHGYAMAPLRVIARVLDMVGDQNAKNYVLASDRYHLWYVRLLKHLNSLLGS